MKDGNQSRYASDEDILTLYNRRDEQAIAATQSKYGSYCRAVADRILRVREDAEECVNDTYLHAWNAIPPARPGSLRAFLGAIVRNPGNQPAELQPGEAPQCGNRRAGRVCRMPAGRHRADNRHGRSAGGV